MDFGKSCTRSRQLSDMCYGYGAPSLTVFPGSLVPWLINGSPYSVLHDCLCIATVVRYSVHVKNTTSRIHIVHIHNLSWPPYHPVPHAWLVDVFDPAYCFTRLYQEAQLFSSQLEARAPGGGQAVAGKGPRSSLRNAPVGRIIGPKMHACPKGRERSSALHHILLLFVTTLCTAYWRSGQRELTTSVWPLVAEAR